MTDAEQVKACPRCGRSEIDERSSQRPRFNCLRCGFEFDEPAIRDRIWTGTGPWTDLAAANPDDLAGGTS